MKFFVEDFFSECDQIGQIYWRNASLKNSFLVHSNSKLSKTIQFEKDIHLFSLIFQKMQEDQSRKVACSSTRFLSGYS